MLNSHNYGFSFAPYGDPFAFFEGPGAEGDGGQAAPNGTPADNKGKGEGEGGDQFPTSWDQVFKHPRFKELNDSNQTLKKQLEEYETAKKVAAEKKEEEETEALKAKEEFKTLAEKTEAKLTAAKEENKELKAKVEAYEKIAAADIAARLGEFPDPLKNLLSPLLEGKSPIDQLQILTEQNETIQALLAPNGQENGEKKKLPRGVPPTPNNDADPEKATEAKKKNWKRGYRGQLRQGL